tara:strand:- start:16133 stop:16798 length:666 start_codon:yes stop_codon:yes gene_type:complete
MERISYKQLAYDIKDFDEKQGIVKAYANAYNNEDSDQDISAKGSFNRTVKNNFKRIRVLKDHNATISLGVPLEIDPEDDFGLLTTTKFNLQKEVARDMFTDIQLMKENGLNAELSIGYNVLQRDQKNKSIITEYKLHEYSFLTSWAANELATVQDIKSIKTTYGLIELIQKSYNLSYSDTRLRNIEELLKALDSKDPSSDTLEVNPLIETLKQFNNSLIQK